MVFFNGNCIFVDIVGVNEFFGTGLDLVACLHPGFFNKKPEYFTYETRRDSSAFVGLPWKYFAGGINGGSSQAFIHICKQMVDNIEGDLEKGIVAIWHDESHWNGWLNNNRNLVELRLHILTPAYLYPNGWKLPFKAKIRLRDKNWYGGHGFLRNNYVNRVKIKDFLKLIMNKF